MSAAPNFEVADHGARTEGRALVPFIAAPLRDAAWPSLRVLAIAGVFGLALGVGGGSLYTLRHHLPWSGSRAGDAGIASARVLHDVQDELGRLQANVTALKTTADAARFDDTLHGLKRSLEAMKQDVEQVRASGATNLAQLSAKIDRVDHDPTPKLAEIAARLDRMERNAKTAAEGPSSRPVDPSGHADRVERAAPAPLASAPVPLPQRPAVVQQIPSRPPASAAKAELTQVPASLPQAGAKTNPTLDGWVLRDVYDGMALVEARGGGLREIEPGTILPGAGEVRSIERRGRNWVVLTSRGVIDNTAF